MTTANDVGADDVGANGVGANGAGDVAVGQATRRRLARVRLARVRLARVRLASVAVLSSAAVAVSLAGPATAATPPPPAPAPAPAAPLGGVTLGGNGQTLPEVDGVKVGWLPAGVSLTQIVPSSRIGYDTVVGYFEGGGSYVTLTVQRSTPEATIDGVFARYAAYYDPDSLGRVPLRGTEAVTLKGFDGGISEMTWVEGSPAVVVTVQGSTAGTETTPPATLPEADLRRIAESLTVGPAPRPSLWHRLSEPFVKAAFSLAFNGTGADPRIPLAAVQNGSQLVSLLEQFRATYPTISATARVTVNRVYFTARDRAHVTFTIAFDYNGTATSSGFGGEAVFDRGFWKVSEQTYRSVLGMAGSLPS